MSSKKVTIQCEWLKDNRVLVNPDGQVWPCCYLGNVGFDINHSVVREYENKKDELIKKLKGLGVLNNKNMAA